MGKKKYYPNNWEEFNEADDSLFIPHTFEEIMSWKVAGWELPSSVCCIIRVQDIKTRKILDEFTYQRKDAAQKKIKELIDTPNIEFVVADHESIHHLSPQQ